jgi:hypothetical protein
VSLIGEAFGERVSERDGERHQRGRFVGREAEHESLITRSTRVDSLRDLRCLTRKERRDLDTVGVERFGCVVIADLANRLTRDRFVIDGGTRGNFAGEDEVAVFDERFARDSARGIER